MRKIRMLISSVILTLTLIALFAPSCVFANAEAVAHKGKIYDNAGLLKEKQAAELSKKAEQMESYFGQVVSILTVDDAGGKKSSEVAEDFYAERGLGANADFSGVLLLIDMDNREAYILSMGKSARLLNDDRIESILDVMQASLAEDNFYGAIKDFFTETENDFKQGLPYDEADYDAESAQTADNSESGEGGKILGTVGKVLLVLLAVAVIGVIISYLWQRGVFRRKDGIYSKSAMTQMYKTEKNDGSADAKAEKKHDMPQPKNLMPLSAAERLSSLHISGDSNDSIGYADESMARAEESESTENIKKDSQPQRPTFSGKISGGFGAGRTLGRRKR